MVYIRVTLNDYSVSHGTGFLINKSSGYSASDRPYIVTCGHLFPDGSSGSSYRYLDYYVNYEDHNCDDFWPRSGTRIRGFNILEFGVSSNLDPNSANYYESDDFALLQSSADIEDLAKHNVQYAGWTTSHNYSINGYVYIGHPKGDVKTVNKWNSYAPVNLTEKFFSVYNNVGVNEEGFSGSPVFSTITNKVIGWVCTKESGTFTCGDGDQYTRCGLFDELHSHISSYIDPTNTGSASFLNPTLSFLPSHCSNCIKDYDETGIDCGGSCQPCGMADEFYVTTIEDIYGRENINARFNLHVDGGGTSVEFQNQNYILTAGESVKLKSTKISNGATFKASVNEALIYSEMQGCQAACVSMANVFTPNGDGQTDFFTASLAFVTKYNVLIRDSWGNTVFSANNVRVHDNGVYVLWDGDGSVNGNNYTVWLTVTDCYGNQSTSTVILACFKSAMIDVVTDISQLDSDVLLLYPNPASNELKISLNIDVSESLYNVRINNILGVTIYRDQFEGYFNKIDISSFKRGTYVLIVDSNSNIYKKRFIKN